MKFKILILTFLCISNVFSQSFETPEWTKDLIVYEIATKGFTSPRGAESGTFNSTKGKISYLHDLGINGVWLSGHQLCAPRFFYHCWNQYAVIRPDSLDPTLGSQADFKSMIDEFHKNGIKVFLDVETHGVMSNSTLIQQHPSWFKGGSWGMIDYDWFGGHKDLDEWWTNVYTNYVTQYGVDGYRLDVDIYRPDIWKNIKNNCKLAGHPIAVWLESDNYSGGACDFLQRQATLSIQTLGLDTNNILTRNVGQYFKERFDREKFYQVEVHYADSSVQYGFTEYNPAKVYYGAFQYPLDLSYKKNMLNVSLLYSPALTPSNEKTEINDESKYIRLKITNLDSSKAITYIKVNGTGYWDVNWIIGSPNTWYTRTSGNSSMTIYLKPFIADIKYYSIQLSSHDDGWDGFPANSNPYVAEGSRCAFGYCCLFTPSIPIFFAGEEFNADYKPVPNLAADLFGKKAEGTGKWLYGSWLQWDQLKQKQHAEMLADVKKMISIRKENADLIHAERDDNMPHIMPLEFKADGPIPVPYLIWNDNKALIIAGNSNNKDILCTITLPAEKIKFKTCKNIWNHNAIKIEGPKMSFIISKDKVLNGGLVVLKME